jgi:hypothetical protein
MMTLSKVDGNRNISPIKRQKICDENHMNDKNHERRPRSFGTLDKLLKDGHELQLDMSCILREEEMLDRLLQLAHQRRQYLEVCQSPLLALDDNLLGEIFNNLESADLCRAECSCRTLQKTAMGTWQDRDVEIQEMTWIQHLTSTTPKARVQSFSRASAKATKLQQLAIHHHIDDSHNMPHACQGCEEYPSRLDTKPLHNVQEYDFFVRITQDEQLVWEGFAPLHYNKGKKEGTSMPSHPKMDFQALFKNVDWCPVNTLLQQLATSYDCDYLTHVQEAAHELLKGLVLTIVAVPQNKNPTSPAAAPVLITTSFGHRSKQECQEDVPMLFSAHGAESARLLEDAVAGLRADGGVLSIPLEQCQVFSHAASSSLADRSRRSFSTLDLNLQLSLPADTRASVLEGLSHAYPGVVYGLEFPKILGVDSSEEDETDAYMLY